MLRVKNNVAYLGCQEVRPGYGNMLARLCRHVAQQVAERAVSYLRDETVRNAIGIDHALRPKCLDESDQAVFGGNGQRFHQAVNTVPPHGLAASGADEEGAGEPSDKDRRRFAFDKAGELWMSDVMRGPAALVEGKKKRKTYW